MCKDGQHALKGRLAVFYAHSQPVPALEYDYYLRSVSIHNRMLDRDQVRACRLMAIDRLSDRLASLSASLIASLSASRCAPSRRCCTSF